MPNLRDSFTFQRRAAARVVAGLDTPGDWGIAAPDAVTLAAEVLYLKGSDAVQASRLQGKQPAVITVCVCAAARLIDNSWRAVDARDATRMFEITSSALSDDRAFIQLLAVQKKGDADG